MPICRPSRRFATLDAKGWETAPERFLLAKAYREVAEVIGWNRAVDFGMRVWEEKRPPSHAVTDPVHGGGWGIIYIPTALTDSAGRELVRLAGSEDAGRLVKAFPGISLEFPCIVAASIPRRNKAITEQVADGHRVAVVACCFDITERQVRRICAAYREAG